MNRPNRRKAPSALSRNKRGMTLTSNPMDEIRNTRRVAEFPATPEDVLDSKYELSAHSIDQVPEVDYPDIAFAGRSNVGKSALINALLGRKDLARTSNTPGKTRALNVYTCRIRKRVGHDYFREGSLQIIDLPGYGYAKVSKAERGKWGPLIEGYLLGKSAIRSETGNSGLWGVALVIDGRRPPMDSDIQMADWLGQNGIHFIALLTKSDKLKQSEKASVWRESEGPLISLGARSVFQISSSRGTGILDVWPALHEMGE